MGEGTAERRRAFRADARTYRVQAAAKALWWTASRAIGRAVVKPAPAGATEGNHPFDSATPPPPPGFVRQAWLEAFAKEAADVAGGLYPVREPPSEPIAAFRRAADLIEDAREVEARRRRGDRVEVRDEAPSDAYPAYYRQNFHFQSGGWFTPESAARYEAQVEALFSGAAGPMRRRALALLAKHWRDVDHRDRMVLDLACGSGAFLGDLAAAFPRARLVGLDLSHAYAGAARERTERPTIQANAERLPLADDSLDAVTCIFLFHELPPRVRDTIAREIARVLKPGGVLAFADSVQASDSPELARLLEAFPVHFHEPYFESYQAADLDALFGRAGLQRRDADQAFLTKALLFSKG